MSNLPIQIRRRPARPGRGLGHRLRRGRRRGQRRLRAERTGNRYSCARRPWRLTAAHGRNLQDGCSHCPSSWRPVPESGDPRAPRRSAQVPQHRRRSQRLVGAEWVATSSSGARSAARAVSGGAAAALAAGGGHVERRCSARGFRLPLLRPGLGGGGASGRGLRRGQRRRAERPEEQRGPRPGTGAPRRCGSSGHGKQKCLSAAQAMQLPRLFLQGGRGPVRCRKRRRAQRNRYSRVTSSPLRVDEDDAGGRRAESA